VIHYQLQCAGGHEFDGWFKSSASFDRQASRGLLECPRCGGHEVARAMMAPRIGGKSRGRSEPEVAAAPVSTAVTPAVPSPGTAVGGPMPAEVRVMLAKIRREIEARCDYVGPDFAAEARRIHDGEAAPRGIYGEASAAEAEALAEDGITVGRIPWVPLADS
jgi:hypothetical protein